MYLAFCDDVQAHIWHILPRKHELYVSNWRTGLEPQYACDPGAYVLHMHLKVDHLRAQFTRL